MPGRRLILASGLSGTASSRADRFLDDLPGRLGLLPEPAGGYSGSFHHRAKLRPDHVSIDGSLSHPGPVATVTAGNDVLAADELGISAKALRNQLRMFDEVRFGFNHSG